MDELNRIARAYFNAFEGRRHYPRLWSWQWAVCAGSFVLWMISIWYYFGELRQTQASSMWILFLMEVIFIGTTIVIENHKRASLLSSRSSSGTSTGERLDALRHAHLTKAFGRTSDEFASIASEAMALVSMNERLRSQSGATLSRFWRNVYDADRNDRLVTVLVSAVSILASLVVVSLPPDAPSVVELVASDGFGPAMNFLFMVTAIAFGFWLAASMAIRGAVRMTSFWVARLASEASFSHMKVRYMLEDLVRLHRVKPERTPRRSPGLKRQATKRITSRRDTRSN